MQIDIIPVTYAEKEILRNLLEKYQYEFSQYDERDVDDLGLFGYGYLDHYWVEDNRFPFFIKVQGKLAGFALVNDYPEVMQNTQYTMSEFFILYKYRHMGIGRYAASYLFNKFKGRWQLKRHPENAASVAFWDNVVSDYTNGQYQLIEACPGADYDDGTFGDVFLFDT